MKVRLIFIIIVICIMSFGTSFSAVQEEDDTISVVNGFVYEDVDIQPLQDFPVYIAELDSFYNLVHLDSVYTDEEGKFSVELARGFYTIIPWQEGYIPLIYYENIELTDSLYNLEFRLISPAISLSEDSLIIQGPFNEPVEKKLIVTNEGSGELIYSCALYTGESLKSQGESVNNYESNKSAGSKQQINLASVKEGSWKLVFRDSQDQDTLQHDISEIWMQTDNEYFYIKAVFYDTIRSFETFSYEFSMNSDRDTSTGRYFDGHDFDIYIGYHNYMLVAVLLGLIDYGWVYIGDAAYTSLGSNHNYIIAGYPLDYFKDTDYMYASSLVRHGENDFTYEDMVPDWQFGEDFIISFNPWSAISIDKQYGEANSAETDTIILTVLPEVLDYNIEECYVAMVCNEPGSEVFTVPVIIQHVTGLVESQNKSSTIDASGYPNPFNSAANIEYFLEQPAHVKLYIYDISGQPVRTLTDEFQGQGSYLIEWDGTDNTGIYVKSGIYVYTIIADDIKVRQKLALIR